MRRLGIQRRRNGGQRRHLSVSSLEIGEHFLIEVPIEREPPSSIYGEAKKIGIRIVIRRLDDQKMMVKRTQLLTPEMLRDMRVAGMTVKAIADEFLVNSRRIVKILRFDSKRGRS